MTTRWAVLLRGVNVGGRNRVAMPELREALESLGYREVATYLQSGNAVVSSDVTDEAELVAGVRRSLAARTGVDVPVIARRAAELAEVVASCPYDAVPRKPPRLHAAFLAAPPDAAGFERVRAAARGDEDCTLAGRTVYAWLPEGLGRSKLGALLAAPALGATVRNWNTVVALHELSWGG